MSGEVEVRVAGDAPPMARIVGNMLKTAVTRVHVAALIRRMRGTFALKSEKDAQHVSVTVSKGIVNVQDGIAPGACPVLSINWSKNGKPGYAPTASGGWRRPLFARRVLRLMSEPPPDWTESAERFWAIASKSPDAPDRLVVTCPADGRSLTLGEGEAAAEIVGAAGDLGQLFAGQAVLVISVMRGKLRVRASLRHIAGLSDAGTALMAGECNG